MSTFKHIGAKRFLRAAAVLLFAAVLTVSATGGDVLAATLPAFDDVLSVSGAKRLSRRYDKDGYFLISRAVAKDKGLFGTVQNFYLTPETRTVDALDTFVHESFHTYTRGVSNPTLEDKVGEKMNVYVGDKKGIEVTITPIFRSKKIVKITPKRCRTSVRFATYVKDTGETMLSDWDGIYGLLNEFGGYCWGLHDNNCLYAYRERFPDTEDTWKSFAEEGESDRLAYAEFKYYILQYLYYAKKYKPEVYEGIMDNEPFKEAYRQMEKRFADEVSTYEKHLMEVKDKLDQAGGRTIDMEALRDSQPRKGYNVLVKEMKKDRYQQLQRELGE